MFGFILEKTLGQNRNLPCNIVGGIVTYFIIAGGLCSGNDVNGYIINIIFYILLVSFMMTTQYLSRGQVAATSTKDILAMIVNFLIWSLLGSLFGRIVLQLSGHSIVAITIQTNISDITKITDFQNNRSLFDITHNTSLNFTDIQTNSSLFDIANKTSLNFTDIQTNSSLFDITNNTSLEFTDIQTNSSISNITWTFTYYYRQAIGPLAHNMVPLILALVSLLIWVQAKRVQAATWKEITCMTVFSFLFIFACFSHLLMSSWVYQLVTKLIHAPGQNVSYIYNISISCSPVKEDYTVFILRRRFFNFLVLELASS